MVKSLALNDVLLERRGLNQSECEQKIATLIPWYEK